MGTEQVYIHTYIHTYMHSIIDEVTNDVDCFFFLMLPETVSNESLLSINVLLLKVLLEYQIEDTVTNREENGK